MAMSMMLRNAFRLSGSSSGVLRSAGVNSLKSYATLIESPRAAVTKPVSLVKNVMPLAKRQISLTSPKQAAVGSNHTPLWTLERAVTLLMAGSIPLAFIYPCQPLDAVLATTVVLHAHWGLEAMVTDYVRPSVVGNIVPKVAHGSLLLVSIAALGGLFYLIYTDVGIANGVKKLWAIKGHNSEDNK